MKYTFADNLTFDEVKNVVDDFNARIGTMVIYCRDYQEFSVFNYIISMPDLWSSPEEDGIDDAEKRRRGILRECRGMAFSKTTGKVVSRSFHKFFNYLEKIETQANRIDWKDHVFSEKLDGSMLRTIDLENGDYVMGTRAGPTQISEEPDQIAHERYDAFIKHWIAKGCTTMYEWCSRKQRIVIDYPVDRLILTAIRHNDSGNYVSYNEMVESAKAFDVDYVKTLEFSNDLDTFLPQIRSLIGQEGTVVVFANGHRLKIKADEYCALHGGMDNLRFEKDVIRLILGEQFDDIKSIVIEDARHSLDQFYDYVMGNIRAFAGYLIIVADEINNKVLETDLIKRKRDIAALVNTDVNVSDRKFIYNIINGKNVIDMMLDHVQRNSSTSAKVEEMRRIIGQKTWNSFYANKSSDSED